MPGLDIGRPAQLISYLRSCGHIGQDEHPDVRSLTGGVSNRTVLVRRPTGEAWVVKQALARLNVAVEWFADPARVHREAAGLRWLSLLLPVGAVPRFVFEDEAEHLLAMEAVPEPHDNWKDLLLAGRCEPGQVAAFAGILADLHRAGRAQATELGAAFENRTFFESLRLEPYYAYAAARAPRAATFLKTLIDDTRARRETLVHGDFSPKNVLVREGRLVLLDHEVIHFGDGAFDVGFGLTHLLSKAHHLVHARGVFKDAAHLFWGTYAGQSGDAAFEREGQAVRHTLACLLARVDGRSPLEYLTPAACDRQREAVILLIEDVPARIPELIDRFLQLCRA